MRKLCGYGLLCAALALALAFLVASPMRGARAAGAAEVSIAGRQLTANMPCLIFQNGVYSVRASGTLGAGGCVAVFDAAASLCLVRRTASPSAPKGT